MVRQKSKSHPHQSLLAQMSGARMNQAKMLATNVGKWSVRPSPTRQWQREGRAHITHCDANIRQICWCWESSSNASKKWSIKIIWIKIGARTVHHEFIPSLGTYHIALKFEESANFWRSAKAGLHNLKRSLEHQETGQKAWWHDLHHEEVVKEGGRQIVAQLRRPEQPPNSASKMFRLMHQESGEEMNKTFWLRYQKWTTTTF